MSSAPAPRGERAEVVVIGSGAGGATTAGELASAGLQVLMLEEGAAVDPSEYGAHSPTGMDRLYRHRGMTPILGRVPVGYVEGCCVGGSTEINSGFWHRTPREILYRWKAQFDLDGAMPEDLAPHFDWAEAQLDVGLYGKPWPASTRVFAAGVDAMGWSAQEVPRVARGCSGANLCASGCPTGAKRSMSTTLVPRAVQAGVQLMPSSRAVLLLRRGRRISDVVVAHRRPDGSENLLRIEADAVFVCAGPTETPALLRRSGIRRNVGNSLRTHPMLKVVARFDQTIDAHRSVLPLIQVKEFWPEISLGGAFFSPGHLAMTLGDNWTENRERMRQLRQLATYYVAVRGTGKGSVRPSTSRDTTTLRYELSDEDMLNLSRGMARLATVLLAGGAVEILPAVHGIAPIRDAVEAARWLDQRLPKSSISLTTVHAFCACPIGERADRCAANSYGKVHGVDNLYVNDASMLPDSPGVNPQGTVMALARRNTQRFLQERAA